MGNSESGNDLANTIYNSTAWTLKAILNPKGQMWIFVQKEKQWELQMSHFSCVSTGGVPIRVCLVLLSAINKKVAETLEEVNRKADSTCINRKTYEKFSRVNSLCKCSLCRLSTNSVTHKEQEILLPHYIVLIHSLKHF